MTPDALIIDHIARLVKDRQGCSADTLLMVHEMLQRRETGYTIAERIPIEGDNVWFVIEWTGRPWLHYDRGRILGGKYRADQIFGFCTPGCAYGHCVSRWGYLPSLPATPITDEIPAQ